MAASAGGDVGRRSLVESTAGLFASRAFAGSVAPVSPTGADPSPDLVLRQPLIGHHRNRPAKPGRPAPVVAGHPATTGETAASANTDISRLPAREFQRLVDAIVDVLEQRVVDELERRGRRHTGVF